MSIEWSPTAQNNFDGIIKHLPQFHRSIAEKLVKEKSEELAVERKSETVEDKDVVTAFFQEVPPAFKDMMKRLMQQQGIDYKDYISG